MKNNILTILLLSFLVGCGEKHKSEPNDNRNIEQITTDEQIVGNFDRKKYPILQNAILLKLNGKLKQSILEFDKAENEYGSLIQIHLNRGVAYDQLGQIEKAEIDFTNCLKIDSNYVPALLNRGLVYAHSNRNEKAMTDFNRAIELKPNEPASYLNRAVAYRETNKIELACLDLNKAKSLGINEKYGSDMTDKMLKELNCEK
jgi:tetratricopeptide (TPR) repeat protein